jgi:hypothetical protein
MSSVERLSRSGLGALNLIAGGGQARVYAAPSLLVGEEMGPFVFKEYRDKRISISGLDGMISFRQRLSEHDRAVLDVLANWPLRVVEGDRGGADGVILPLISPPFFHELRLPDGSRKRLPRDAQYLAQPPERCHRVGIRVAGLGDRYRFCRDLAFAVGFLHRRDVCIGDISFKNLAYAVDIHPSVYLVDCDAFRLKGSSPVVPQLHTPDWVPPEGSRVQSVDTDLYKLGLYVLRVLTPRALSGQNRDPCWADDALDPRGRYLLRKSLAAAGSAPPRTTAKEWVAYFDGALRRRTVATTPHRSHMPRGPVSVAT